MTASKIDVSKAFETPKAGVTLCASCDRCRARKTKCDGRRPCGNCVAKYMKKHQLVSIEGLDPSVFECVYSPAKRRGPVPGKAGQVRKAEAMGQKRLKRNSNLLGYRMIGQQQQQQQPGPLGPHTNRTYGGGGVDQVNGLSGAMDPAAIGAAQHRMMAQHQASAGRPGTLPNGTMPQDKPSLLFQQQMHHQQQQLAYDQMMNKMRPKSDGFTKPSDVFVDAQNPSALTNTLGLASSVTEHLPLLEKTSIDGNRLRSYYELSIDGINRLPPVPSDEAYCLRVGGGVTPTKLPRFDLAALRAARFSEIALGALVNDQETLALQLSNATVTCLRQCMEDKPIHSSCIYDVARAYYLHGLFRCYRGDLVRYFKYRRVCLNHLSQTIAAQGIDTFIAAISFHDSWAYMMYNANEDALPPIDDVIPPLTDDTGPQPRLTTPVESKYSTSTDPRAVVRAYKNQMWLQGAPPVFINEKSPPLSRCLDALACAIRSCCDKANYCRLLNGGARNNGARTTGTNNGDNNNDKKKDSVVSSETTRAVAENDKELCPRNMVLSAFTLLQQHESHILNIDRNQGHHLIISAMDAFLEGGDEEESGGLSDTQIQSLLFVCSTIIEHPHLLYQPGPTYHIVSNTAILLCHLLNGLHSNRDSSGKMGEMETELFLTVLDTFLTLRKVLNLHSSKLPVCLRCHEIPRPNLLKGASVEEGVPFIDLGCTVMCSVKGCQTFVLMGCSPLVAAERSQTAARNEEKSMTAEKDTHDEALVKGPFESELSDLAHELDMDDDALLDVLSRVIAS